MGTNSRTLDYKFVGSGGGTSTVTTSGIVVYTDPKVITTNNTLPNPSLAVQDSTEGGVTAKYVSIFVNGNMNHRQAFDGAALVWDPVDRGYTLLPSATVHYEYFALESDI